MGTQRQSSRIRRIALLCIAIIVLVFQILGFFYLVIVSAFLLALSIYEYNLPRHLFGEEAKDILGEHIANQRIGVAVRCGLAVLGGAIIQKSLPQLYQIMFLQGAVENVESVTLVFLSWFLAGLFILLIPAVWQVFQNISLSKTANEFRSKFVEQYVLATGAFGTLAFFIGLGGGRFVTLTVLALTVLSFFRTSISTKNAGIVEIATQFADRRGAIMTDIWETWQKGRTANLAHLRICLAVLSVFLVFNIGFFDYYEPLQIIFIAMILFSVLLIYYEIKKECKNWRLCSIFMLPLFSAFVFSFLRPSAMPFVKVMMTFLSQNIESNLAFSRGQSAVLVFCLFVYGGTANALIFGAMEKARTEKDTNKYKFFVRVEQAILSIWGCSFVILLRWNIWGFIVYDIAKDGLLLSFMVMSFFLILELTMRHNLGEMMKESG